MKKETAYGALWNHLRFLTHFECPEVKPYFGKAYILSEAKRLGMRWAMKHAKRYLNQFVANGTVSKKLGGYRVKARYMNLVEPKPRVKVASELNRNGNGG
jgi:hypothetical protein